MNWFKKATGWLKKAVRWRTTIVEQLDAVPLPAPKTTRLKKWLGKIKRTVKVAPPLPPLPLPLPQQKKIEKTVRRTKFFSDIVELKREQILRKIEIELERLRDESSLSKYDPSIRIIENADGSIDSELRLEIYGMDASDAVVELNMVSKKIIGAWISVGVVVPPKLDKIKNIPENYLVSNKKIVGMAHWQRGNKMHGNFANSRTVIDGFEKSKHKFRKPTELLLLWHWNPYDKKPGRDLY